MVRPNADVGDEHPSSLSYIYRPDRIVPHVVLGKGTPGGSWNEFSPEIITLSFASWLDLPAYSFRDWLEKEGANFATELQMKIDASAEVVGKFEWFAEIMRFYFKSWFRFRASTLRCSTAVFQGLYQTLTFRKAFRKFRLRYVRSKNCPFGYRFQ